MSDLEWIIQRRFLALSHREYDWIIEFDGQATLVVECLWRLIENERIRLTSLDQGQQFGLPTPVDAVPMVNARLANAIVVAVELRDGTLDLRISFDTGHVIEVIPDSSGYEAWNLCGDGAIYVAVGGGDLAIFKGKPPECAEQGGEPERR